MTKKPKAVRPEMKKPKEVVRPLGPEAKKRNCLGRWCGHKEFFSTSFANRYCKKCTAKMEQAVLTLPGIKRCETGSG